MLLASLERISIDWNHLYGGQRRALARRAHQAARGGRAEPVTGPAEDRTRWLCPPYDASIRPETRSTTRGPAQKQHSQPTFRE